MKPQKIIWADNLRAVATLAVIFLHGAGYLFGEYNKFPNNIWMSAVVYDGFTRFCVPVFLMITGYFLLGKEYEPKPYFTKRFTRILYPFIFWSIVYIVYGICMQIIKGTSIDWQGHFHSLFTGASHQMWYLYMLIPMYIFIPLIGPSLKNISKSFISVYLIIWFLLSFGRWGVHIDNAFDFSNFNSFLGYLILGYYLKRFPVRISSIYILVLFILVSILIIFCTYYFSVAGNGLVVKFRDYLTPFVIIQPLLIFIYFQNSERMNRYNKFIYLISYYSFGIYFIHVLFFEIFAKLGLGYYTFNPWVSIPVITILNIFTSLIVLICMERISLLNRFNK